MKLKLLLMPSIIALSIILLIWLVYPAYSNDTDGLKERYNQLGLEKEKLSDIENKSLNIAKLSSDLSALSEDREFIEKFLPENIKEEEIIDNLNFLANSSGLSVLDISVEKLKKVEKAPAIVADQSVAMPDPEGFMGTRYSTCRKLYQY
jgi:Tfp pilus assembly protein PilO